MLLWYEVEQKDKSKRTREHKMVCYRDNNSILICRDYIWRYCLILRDTRKMTIVIGDFPLLFDRRYYDYFICITKCYRISSEVSHHIPRITCVFVDERWNQDDTTCPTSLKNTSFDHIHTSGQLRRNFDEKRVACDDISSHVIRSS